MIQEDSSAFFKPFIEDSQPRPIILRETPLPIDLHSHGRASDRQKIVRDHEIPLPIRLPGKATKSSARSEQSTPSPANALSIPRREDSSVFSEISDLSLRVEQITRTDMQASAASAVLVDRFPAAATPWVPEPFLPAWLRRKELAMPLGLVMASCIASLVVVRTAQHPGQAMAIIFVLMCSACVSSVVGFAFSAIAGASLYHFVNSPLEAVCIMLWCSIAIQVYSVIRLWGSIQWPRLIPFLAGGFLTVTPFCWLVLHISPKFYLAGIGLFIAIYGTYLSLRKPLTVKPGPKTSMAVDLMTGALGGMTGPFAAFPGAAITIWCGMRGWDKVVQRSIFQPYILIMQVVTLGVFSFMGGSSSFRPSSALFAIPAVLGCHIGLILFERLSNQHVLRMERSGGDLPDEHRNEHADDRERGRRPIPHPPSNSICSAGASASISDVTVSGSSSTGADASSGFSGAPPCPASRRAPRRRDDRRRAPGQR